MIILLRFMQAVFGIFFLLPPAVALYLMHFAGETTYRIARLTPIKKITAKNFRLFFPAADTKQLADKLLKNISYSLFEVLCIPFFKESHYKKTCKINGLENIDLSLAKRKGAILISIHAGNYEIVPNLLGLKGYRLNSILRAPNDPIFNLINRGRSHQGVKLINVLEANMYREALKALGNNEIICLLIDTGALEGRHETFEFLGKKVPVATGWLALAQRSEAPIIPCLARREGKKLVISFFEPLTIYSDNREAVMQKIGQLYENFIRSHPDQWAMFLNEQETRRMVEGK